MDLSEADYGNPFGPGGQPPKIHFGLQLGRGEKKFGRGEALVYAYPPWAYSSAGVKKSSAGVSRC